MLVLSRRLNEKVNFPGLDITVQVVALKSGVVRLGIEAPPDVTILRAEIPDRAREWEPSSVQPIPTANDPRLQQLNQLVQTRLKIANAGLEEIRRQLQAGLTQEASTTLDQLAEEFQMLRQRMGGEVKKKAPQPNTQPKPRTALLVEDNVNERELLATYLRSTGLDVAAVGDGADALDYLHRRGSPDVVLMDMGLPRCDGATAIRAIREDPAYQGLKIFAVSGHFPEEFDLARGPAGVDRWFHKPIDPEELVHDLNQDLCHR